MSLGNVLIDSRILADEINFFSIDYLVRVVGTTPQEARSLMSASEESIAA